MSSSSFSFYNIFITTLLINIIVINVYQNIIFHTNMQIYNFEPINRHHFALFVNNKIFSKYIEFNLEFKTLFDRLIIIIIIICDLWFVIYDLWFGTIERNVSFRFWKEWEKFIIVITVNLFDLLCSSLAQKVNWFQGFEELFRFLSKTRVMDGEMGQIFGNGFNSIQKMGVYSLHHFVSFQTYKPIGIVYLTRIKVQEREREMWVWVCVVIELMFSK